MTRTSSPLPSSGVRNEWYVGLDLGKVTDPTALVLLQRQPGFDPALQRQVNHFKLRYLDRFQLGTDYTTIVKAVVDFFEQPDYQDQFLVVDQTGVGGPVVDMLRAAKPRARIIPVTITSGQRVSRVKKGPWNVPKQDLVGALQAVFQQQRLHVAPAVKLWPVLEQELNNFRLKVTKTGKDTYEAYRSNQHDDLVLACALAVWFAERALVSYSSLIRQLREPQED